MRSEASVLEEERAARDGPRRILMPLIALSGLFATLMFAAAAQGLPQFGDWKIGAAERTVDEDLPAPTGSVPPVPDPPEESPLLAIIGVVLAAVVVAAVLTLAYLGVRMLIGYLRGLWRDRPLARQEATQVGSEHSAALVVEGEPDGETIRRGIAEALRTIEARPVPGDGIVAAWVGLEESASDAGAGRGANETPSEFTVRIVGQRTGIADEVVTLLALYENVRFGGHEADEDDRATALACLRGIQAGWR